MGESAQGLANYVKEHVPPPHSCAIAFDTRHRSVEFSKLCASVMVAAGFKVFYLDEIRSTPELSFAVRFKRCSCGIIGDRQPQPSDGQRDQSVLVDGGTDPSSP